MAMSRAEQQYLDRYAEPEARGIGALGRRFGHVLTIPAYGEGSDLKRALDSIPAGPRGDVLTVLVVNGRVDSPPVMQRANFALLDALRAERGRGISVAPNASLHEHPRGALLLVDRATPGNELPPRQGVGLARKIAADIALAIRSRRDVTSEWIHCTDADVVLPVDYFEAASRDETPANGSRAAGTPPAALLYPFRHVDATPEALEYEIALRYYVAGLRFAGSPYAFHTIGSTLAVHASAYAQVRGFPKRLAAEDFYLLNKLAKVGAIHSLDGEPIALSARASRRTPFGTGRALERARGSEPDRARLHVYHPEVFSDLGAWLQTLRALSAPGPAADLDGLLETQVRSWPAANAQRLRAQLDRTGAWQAARVGIERCRSSRTRAKHLHGGFDAFRTLKLIHALRAGGLASIPLREALCAADFVDTPPGAALEAIRERLARAERDPNRPSALNRQAHF